MPVFELKVAWRHLKNGGAQTWLTIGAVALGAFLVVFMSSLIGGLQHNLTGNIIGVIPNITISEPDYIPKSPWQVGGVHGSNAPVVSKTQRSNPHKTNISSWQELDRDLEHIPGVQAVSPLASGGGFVRRGTKDQSIQIIGVIPERQLRTVRLQDRILSGNFRNLDSEGVFIGTKLASDLSVAPGDKLRIVSSVGNTRVFTIRGLFDLGLQSANQTTVYMQLRPAQGLLGIGTDVAVVNVKVNQLFDAEKVAGEISKITPLKVESWMTLNRSFLQALQSQSATSFTIQFVAVLASAFAVSSVLIVFVVQKSMDIGILKSMGATGRQILRIFTFEGLAIGAGGALLGSLVGSAICLAIEATKIPGRGFIPSQPGTFIPMQWQFIYVVIAMASAITVGFFSSLFPARRAAALNPVEVIRGG